MPRKDPITGCNVMTQAEFFASEAARNGTTASEEFEAFYTDIEKMRAECEKNTQATLADPTKALAILLEGIKWSNEGLDEVDQLTPLPTKVVRTFDIESSEGLRDSILRFKAEVSDGRILQYSSSHSSGSFYEPPDGETIVEVVP